MMFDVGRWATERAHREECKAKERHARERHWHFKFVIFRIAKWTDSPHDTLWNRRVILVLGTYARFNMSEHHYHRRAYMYGPVTFVLKE
jgi:hypothetical protein